MDDDLISREKALEVVKRHMCDSARIEQGILELQTAYSIDKVVKQINEEGGMERLTGRSANGTAIYSKPSRDTVKWWNNRCDVLCKLAEYEDLEEQGLLLRLPCKVGDTVYCIMTGLSYKNPYIFKMKFDYELMKHFGKRVFLTREEAEAALHMQGDRHD